jgi:hypothetical protein
MLGYIPEFTPEALRISIREGFLRWDRCWAD